VWAVVAAGSCLFCAVSVSELWATLVGVFALGVAAGAVYVLGFTILHESVADELRGRVFSALYTLVRFCLLVAIAVGGFLSEALDWVFDQAFDSEIGIGAARLQLTGVRGALWLAAAFIWMAAGLAAVSLRDASEAGAAGATHDPESAA
jgi:MFS family permease